MKFQTAVNQATRNLLRSKKARTAGGETLTLEKVDGGLNAEAGGYEAVLEVTDWGWDRAAIGVPESRPALNGRKMMLQIGPRDALDEIELRYLLNILRIESDNS
jgi:hypothetical protein